MVTTTSVGNKSLARKSSWLNAIHGAVPHDIAMSGVFGFFELELISINTDAASGDEKNTLQIH